MHQVLVIDDDATVLWTVVYALRRAGFQVTGCCSGTEAIRAAASIRPDIVLCDVVMPDMDGYSVLQSLRMISEFSDLPFIFLTGRESVRDMRAGMELGADDYLPKSLSITEVERALRARIARRDTLRKVHDVHGAAFVPDFGQMCRMGLSRRESEVMRWVIEGKTNEEIGVILGISRATVRTHLQNIFPKLGVENRLAAAQAARRGLQLAGNVRGLTTPKGRGSRRARESKPDGSLAR
jgi:DNA-binding NarL/FixJ family response regulator